MADPASTIEALHQRYAGVIYDKCVRILANGAEAEDAVQETFVSAFGALHRFEDQGQGHLPWLYRIATNVCLKHVRSHRRKQQARPAEQGVADGASTVGGAVASRQILERLVDGLDDRGQAIFIEHFIDGLDQATIARNLGISRRAVVKRLTAMREVAGKLMEGHPHG